MSANDPTATPRPASRTRALVLAGVGLAVLVIAAVVVVGLVSGGAASPPDGEAAPAYVSTATGAPEVERPDATDATDAPVPSGGREAAEAAILGEPVTYDDGVVVTSRVVGTGTVTDSGAGVQSGAGYVVLEATVHNGSTGELDLSTVVPTLRYGSDSVVASPLYDGVDVADLTGVLAADETATGRYAFIVPADDRADSTIWLDLDAAHDPAEFTGSLPRS